jgi:hypothetical protein
MIMPLTHTSKESRIIRKLFRKANHNLSIYKNYVARAKDANYLTFRSDNTSIFIIDKMAVIK